MALAQSKSVPRIATKFTTPANNTQLRICARPNCKVKKFPPGTEFQLVEDGAGLQDARWVCTDCYQYYMTKAETRLLGMLNVSIL